ncbi:hypothetical protein SAMN04487975_105181 [Planococcus glaciei]|uniref:hypothetical protein n=1 Tax=Planococcus glaciei TaxID=459472 RepID=UPI00088B5A37|nr:hypothetical protein [Planococcus glaciei]SDH54505.1 hypothetical protein SAMN04487975_105181 [Planococcus glaciei]
MESPKALRSAYLKYKLNEDIPLYNGEAEVFLQENKVRLKITVILQWLPAPSVRFKGTIISSVTSLFNASSELLGKKQKIIFPDGTKHDTYIQDVIFGSENTFEGTIEGYSTNRHANVNSISFSVINFLNCLGRYVESDTRTYSGRLIFHYNQWQITLDKRSDYDQKPERIMKQLKDRSGYLITHIGRIERIDGGDFNTNEIRHLINSISWLLSFASGRHVGVSLLEGQYNGEMVWFDNTVPIISPWKNNITWFPKQKAEVIEDLFPVIATRFENEYLAKILRESLSWYVECHSNSIIETKIVSAQTALEMLSWDYLVNQSNQLSKTQFKKKKTSENIRILLQDFQIDTAYLHIPEFQQLEFDDAVHLLIETRNDVVHPIAKQEFNGFQKYMILQIGLHYLELVLLGILEYDKHYHNRLKQPIWEENYDIVPWAKKR